MPSLSARRAWIEIVSRSLIVIINTVALRKESVDRNFFRVSADLMQIQSLSARRAWIEIPTTS